MLGKITRRGAGFTMQALASGLAELLPICWYKVYKRYCGKKKRSLSTE